MESTKIIPLENAVRIIEYLDKHATHYRKMSQDSALENVQNASRNFLSRYSEQDRFYINSVTALRTLHSLSSGNFSQESKDTADKRMRELAGDAIDYFMSDLFL